MGRLLYGSAAGALVGMVVVQVKDVTGHLERPWGLPADTAFYLFGLTLAAAIWCQ